jgi:uncharacterized metal-binding protein YceD (DUF177 family)
MPLRVNIHHLERGPLRFRGEIPAAELDLEGTDELIRLRQPLIYDLEVEKMDQAIVARGMLELTLECECARCLKAFQYPIRMTDWACLLALEGEEKAPVEDDLVDLTPPMREDMLLEFPQHPLCGPECGGLPRMNAGKVSNTGGAGQTNDSASAWAKLNKLKF